MRRGVWLLLVVLAIVSSACGDDPPEKEIQQAQGAIDAANAAGAEQYAKEEFTAAQEALKHARSAVDERDYRLALNYALDAREQARNAAKDAADHKATARLDADRALRDAAAALEATSARLRVAEAGHAPAKQVADLRQAIADGEMSLQKARAALQQGDYLAVVEAAERATLRLRDTTPSLEPSATTGQKRRK